MKVLLVFANGSVRNKTADPELLKEILQKAAADSSVEMECFVTYARSLSFFISNESVRIRDGRNHRDLEEYDFVYFRKAGMAMQQMQVCAQYLADRGVPFYDTELLKANSRNKLSQMYMLQRKGLPIAKTLFCRNNRRLLRLVNRQYAEHFAYPLIAKATGGTRGDANYLVKDGDELARLLNDEKRHFLIQEFIPNDGDYRFFVAGGVLRGVIARRSGGDSHLNNTSKGGSAELVPIDRFSDLVRSESTYAALIFGRDCAGVDVMFDKRTGKHYFLEVNRAPQIDGSSFESEKGRWMVAAIEETVANHEPQTTHTEYADRPVIGRFEAVYLDGEKIIAKIDTGADTSSIHCSDVRVADGILHCRINDVEREFVSYHQKSVKSSNGHTSVRYLVELPVRIGEKEYHMKVTLNDRSAMTHTMLIGRRFLRANNFFVDVTRRYIQSSKQKKGAVLS